jgi:1,4-alpha-glucan branching enzyme
MVNFLVMSIKKQYLKTKPVASVTFQLPAEAAEGASKVNLVGEFNGWDKAATEMKKLKTGDFKATVKLETGKEYQFRYLIDGEVWENDWEADKYVPNQLTFEDNSVVEL